VDEIGMLEADERGKMPVIADMKQVRDKELFQIEGVSGHMNEEIINAVIIGKNVLKRMLSNAGLAS
jgi:hypothetical protein